MEYQNIMDIVKKVLIGWNHKTKQGSKGIFGIPIAYVDACEEQGRKTLHSHMNIWIKDFNKVRDAIFSKNQTVIPKQQKLITISVTITQHQALILTKTISVL